MLIEHKNSLVLLGSNFKQNKKVLYDDPIISDLYTFEVNDFNKINSDLYCIETSFKNYYFEAKDKILVNDFLTNESSHQNVENLFIEDKLIIKGRYHNFLKQNIKFDDLLYLKNYDYSKSISDIVLKYNLPQKFLIKALTTGCPDNEFPEAKEYNLKLDRILKASNYNLEDLKIEILNTYTHKVNKQYLKLNYKFLDLIYLCITNNYELLSDTSLKLKIKDKSIFENVLKLLLDLNITRTVYNDIYNAEEYSIILLNSSLLYNLFDTKFHNYNFLLNMSKLFSNYLFYKLVDFECFYLDDQESLSYLQEFFFRYAHIYKKEIIDDRLYLVQNNDYKRIENGFVFSIKSIEKVEDKHDYLRLS